MLDLVGKRFGRLVVVEDSGLRTKSRGVLWLCKCDCGGTATVRTSHLHNGNSKSCGCARRESVTTHGQSRIGHLGLGSPEYRAWRAMLTRCYASGAGNYRWYGAIGVTVCDRWRASFEAFLADVGTKPAGKFSLDRFPNKSGNYEPGNVRWATDEEQNRNRRPSSRSGKLEPHEPDQIRWLRLETGATYAELGAFFEVSPGMVSMICRDKTWRNAA